MIKNRVIILRTMGLLLLLSLILFGCKETKEIETQKESAEQSILPSPEKPSEEISANFNQEFNALKQNLLSAQKGSGEVSPEMYQEMETKIKFWEEKGYAAEMQELKILLSQFKVGGTEENSPVANQTAKVEETVTPPQDLSPVRWDYREGKWIPTREPPACPEPLVLQVPVDVDKVTGLLYPGQVRSNDFKPHGGFATNGQGPDIVRAPLDGYIKDVAYFTDEFGVHYMYDIQHECGIMMRLGHLGAVPEKFQAVFDTVTKRGYKDSVTMEVESFAIEAGEIIATNSQTGDQFDLGVYDLRQENKAAQDPAFREAHADEPWQAYYSVCWLDFFTEEESKKLRALPGIDWKSGKESAYCE